MRMVLQARDLWEVVSGEEVKPGEENAAQAWEKKARKALATIALAVSAAEKEHIIECARAGPGRGRVPVDCNVKIIYESDPAQYFLTIAFSNAKAHGAHRVTISARGVNRSKGVRITCGGTSR